MFLHFRTLSAYIYTHSDAGNLFIFCDILTRPIKLVESYEDSLSTCILVRIVSKMQVGKFLMTFYQTNFGKFSVSLSTEYHRNLEVYNPLKISDYASKHDLNAC